MIARSRGDPESGFAWSRIPIAAVIARGTGMGLAIVTRVLDARQGLVELTDRPGGGAEFCILLPATQRRSEFESAADPHTKGDVGHELVQAGVG